MGTLLSYPKKSVESLAFPAPKCSYDKTWKNFKYIKDEPNNLSVACMFYKANNDRTTLVYSHGNACDIGYMNNFLTKLSRDLNINIISYDYIGYGLTKCKVGKSTVSSQLNEQFWFYCFNDIVTER